MLAEERFSKILSIIEIEGSATMQELMTALDADQGAWRCGCKETFHQYT